MPIVRRARRTQSQFHSLSFAGLVAMSRCPNPIPFRTRSLNALDPMVLRLKTGKSRSLPGLPRTERESLLLIQDEAAWTSRSGGFVLGLLDVGLECLPQPSEAAAERSSPLR